MSAKWHCLGLCHFYGFMNASLQEIQFIMQSQPRSPLIYSCSWKCIFETLEWNLHNVGRVGKTSRSISNVTGPGARAWLAAGNGTSINDLNLGFIQDFSFGGETNWYVCVCQQITWFFIIYTQGLLSQSPLQVHKFLGKSYVLHETLIVWATPMTRYTVIRF